MAELIKALNIGGSEYNFNASQLNGFNVNDICNKSGENIIVGSSTASIVSNWSSTGWSGSITTYDVENGIYEVHSYNGWRTHVYEIPSEYLNTTLSYSFDVYYDSEKSTQAINGEAGITSTKGYGAGIFAFGADILTKPNTWVHYSGSFTPTDTDKYFGFFLRCTDSSSKSTYIRVKNLKIEKGNLSSIWTPSIKDVGFYDFSNNGNSAKLNIGGVTKELTINYANTSGSAVTSTYASRLGDSSAYHTKATIDTAIASKWAWNANDIAGVTVNNATNSSKLINVDGILFPRMYKISNVHNKYIKLCNINILQHGRSAVLRILIGAGYNAIASQAKLSTIVIRTSNNTPNSAGYYYAGHVESYAHGSYSYYVVQNSSTSFTIWTSLTSYTGDGCYVIPEIIDGTYEHINESYSSLPTDAVELPIYQISYSGHTHNYLPLSGGTIDGNFGSLKIKRNAAWASAIKFENSGGDLGYIGFNDDYSACIWNSSSTVMHTLIHSGNIGSYALTSLPSHTHDYLPLSGGTITGDLNIKNSTSPRSSLIQFYNSGSSAASSGILGFMSTIDSSNNTHGLMFNGSGVTENYGGKNALMLFNNRGSNYYNGNSHIFNNELYVNNNIVYHAGNLSKSTLGLGNVDNTADANKSVNYATSAGTATSAKRCSTKQSSVSSSTNKYYKVAGLIEHTSNRQATYIITTRLNENYYMSIGTCDGDNNNLPHITRLHNSYGKITGFTYKSGTLYIKSAAYNNTIGISNITNLSDTTISIADSTETEYNTGTNVPIWDNLNSGNSSVSKSGETLTVKINGTECSLTNTNSYPTKVSELENDTGYITFESGLYTFTKSLNVTTDWMDTGISGKDLSTGTYAIQLRANLSGTASIWDEYFSGIMSWFDGACNSSDYDEIFLHKAGHATNSQSLFLRTIRQTGSNYLKLQIASSTAFGTAKNLTFKFKKLI